LRQEAVQRDVHKQCRVPRCRQLPEFAEHHEFVIKKGRDTQARVCPCFMTLFRKILILFRILFFFARPKVRDALVRAHESINKLALVPESF